MVDANTETIVRILGGGGVPCIALLQYCVRLVTMEPLFVFLAREYRLRPTHAAALALYDVFCAPRAPAAIRCARLLPSSAMAFASTIDTIRRQWQQIQQPVPPEAAIPVSNPMSGLFDRIAEDLITDREGRIAAIARNYDPALDLAHNLPRRTAGQRHFVENVWKPLVRPHLVAAGFWRVQTIE